MNYKIFAQPNKYFIILIFIILSFIFVFPIFENINNWGVVDWDLQFSYGLIQENSITDYQQMPLWNSWMCGGKPMLGYPLSSFLHPGFILFLLFGTIIGFKILIFFHLILGLFGMYWLMKHFKVNDYFAMFASFVFMFSSIYPLTAGYGAAVYAWSISLMPLVFLFFLKSLKEKKYVIHTSMFLCLMIVSGGIYIFLYTIMFLMIYLILLLIEKRKWKIIIPFIIIIVLTILLSAVKLAPMMEYTQDHNRNSANVVQDYNSFPRVLESLIDSDQKMTSQHNVREESYEGHNRMWWEYGMYIGLIPLAIFLLGFGFIFRKQWKLYILSIIFLFISMEQAAPINFHYLTKFLPIYNTLDSALRYKVIFIFMAAIIVGITAEKIYQFLSQNVKIKHLKLIFIIIILIVIMDLISVNGTIFEDVFIMSPKNVSENPYFTQTVHEIFPDSTSDHITARKSNHLEYVMKNTGSVNCYDVLPITNYAKSNFSKSYKGEVYLKNKTNIKIVNKTVIRNETYSVKVLFWSPNKIITEVNTSINNSLLINQNHMKGWRVFGTKDKVAKSNKGLISTEVSPENKLVIFYYMPLSFIWSSIITIISFLIMIIIYRRIRKIY